MKVNIYDMLNFEELSLSEKFCYSTLRIEATIPPSYLSTGAGFLFNFKIDEHRFVPCLITNKHVINGSTKTAIVITCQLSNGTISHEKVHVDTELWIMHPDSTIDLCILPIQPVYGMLNAQGKPHSLFRLTKALFLRRCN